MRIRIVHCNRTIFVFFLSLFVSLGIFVSKILFVDFS